MPEEVERMAKNVNTSANTANANDARLQACRVVAASGHTQCWCGRDATVSRIGADVRSDYCSDHWMTWWENALLGHDAFTVAG